MNAEPHPGLRIGELAERVGVSPHVLRVWERRYGLRPERSEAGHRVYSPADEERVRAVGELRRQGVPAAEAVAHVLATSRAASPTATTSVFKDRPAADDGVAVARLLRVTEDFDELEGQRILDALLEHRPLPDVVGRVLLPFLEVLGDRWAEGRMSVAQEHFASNLVRRRLSALSLAQGAGSRPVAVLACPPGERHDIALLAFGLLLARKGWRICFLGADTPLLDTARAARAVGADVVVLAATRPSALEAHTSGLRHLARHHRVLLGGRGADGAVARELGADLLPVDPVEAAATLGASLGIEPPVETEAAGA